MVTIGDFAKEYAMRTFTHPVGGGLALLMIVCLLLEVVAAGARAQPSQRCFQETNQCIEGRFREYWEQNGGLPVFGFPITPARSEVNREDGRSYPTQWFERTRYELHADQSPPYDVLLGRIGDDRLRQRGIAWESRPRAQGPQDGCLWFEQTRHNVCNQAGGLGFATYWQTHGLLAPALDGYGRSLALFGLPLSEAAMEVNAADGRAYLTQWFERARFEWHPDESDQYKVLLGLLAAEIQAEAPASPTAVPTAVPTATPTAVPTVTPTEEQASDSPLKHHDAPPNGVEAQLSYTVLNEGWLCLDLAGNRLVKVVETNAILSHPAIVSVVNICATNFVANANLQFELRLPNGSVRRNQVRTNNGGSAVWEVTILPGDPTGDYTITATQNNVQATNTFTVQQPLERRMLIFPPKGPAGGRFRIALAGYAPYQVVTLDLYYYEKDKSLCPLLGCHAYLTRLPPVQTDAQGTAIYVLRTQPDDPPNTYLVNPWPDAAGSRQFTVTKR